MNSPKKPKISVIMPTLNAEKYLKEAIDSILAQTFKNFEFIIIDDNSTDNTLNIINEYKDKRIKLIKGKNKGIASALNLGIKCSKGEYIARMDADDISLPRRFEKQIQFMDQHPEIGICGANVIPLTDDQKYKSWGSWLKTEPKVIDILLNVAFCHPTVIFRKSIIINNNLYYNEKLKYTEDQELWFRAIKFTNFKNIKKKLLKYRLHPKNKSNKNTKKQKNTLNQLRFAFLKWIGVDSNDCDIDQKINDINSILKSKTSLIKENELLKKENKSLKESRSFIFYRLTHKLNNF